MKQSLQAAVQYLLNHKHYFAVPAGAESNEDIKPFVELVFLYNMFPHVVRAQADWQVMKAYILSQLDEHDFAQKVRKNIAAIAGVAVLEEFLLLEGASRYNDVLTELVTADDGIGRGRTPFRIMDTKYSLQQAAIVDTLPSYEVIYADTVLGKGLSSYYLSPMAMYSITHTIFYLTAMGRSTAYLHLLTDKKQLLINLITEHIARGDLDILGEVLLCCFFVRLDTDPDVRPLIVYAVNYMISQQLDDGAFPAPIESQKKMSEEAKFRLRYHTTLVCIGALICYMEKIS